jgi:hypothetical protein
MALHRELLDQMVEQAVDNDVPKDDPGLHFLVILGMFPGHGERMQLNPDAPTLAQAPADLREGLPLGRTSDGIR